MVRIGRSRLPPEVIRCLATSGIIVTSDPVRDRIAALTRSMSAATSSIRRSTEALPCVSNGPTTATIFTPGVRDKSSIETLCWAGKGVPAFRDAEIAVGRRGCVGNKVADRGVDGSVAMRQVVELVEGREPAAGLRRRVAVLVPCYNEEAALGRRSEERR